MLPDQIPSEPPRRVGITASHTRLHVLREEVTAEEVDQLHIDFRILKGTAVRHSSLYGIFLIRCAYDI